VRAAARARRFSLHERASGILLHPTSLPGPWGSGDLGPAAHELAEALAAAGQRVWQMLPVGPAGFGNSPYSALSAFAGNPLLISPDALAAEGLLGEPPAGVRNTGRVDYAQAARVREGALRTAFGQFQANRAAGLRNELASFSETHAHWLDDFALFSALKRAHGEVAWIHWPRPLRLREPRALAEAQRALAGDLAFIRFQQFLFDRHWRALQRQCARLGIALVGDLPLFVAHDSADVWANRELFDLDKEGNLAAVAGVPPDYFSADGQRWGNPLYRWERMKQDGYSFWIRRLSLLLDRFDAVRLDHFIGFVRYWEIPAGAPTAKEGRFRKGPGLELFETLRSALGSLPLIAEDLGLVTPEVTALREALGLPGIRILQFGFGTDPQASTFLPHNYPRCTVAYTGTHDNDTTVGWFNEEEGGTRSAAQTAKERRAALEYLGCGGDAAREIHWQMIRGVFASVANLAVIPMQDLLGLGNEARMNHPGTLGGNWEWRLKPGQLTARIGARLGRLTELYGRGSLPSAALAAPSRLRARMGRAG
jgi:4-alpha-glucanotransferase